MKRRSSILEAVLASLVFCAGCGTGPETQVLVTTEDGAQVFEKSSRYDGSRREMQFDHEGKPYFLLLYSKDAKSPFTGKDKREWHLELYRDAIKEDTALTQLIEEDPATSGSLGGCGAAFDDRGSRLRVYFGHAGKMMTAGQACERVARPR